MSLFVITVIKNVKKAHQIQDSGEFQEFNDDVEYIMDGLKMKKNVSTRYFHEIFPSNQFGNEIDKNFPFRCLSTVTLATKCMEPSFRMHLRAHGKFNFASATDFLREINFREFEYQKLLF